MRRYLLTLSLVTIFTLALCGGCGAQAEKADSAATSLVAEVNQPAAVEAAPAPVEEPVAVETPAPAPAEQPVAVETPAPAAEQPAVVVTPAPAPEAAAPGEDKVAVTVNGVEIKESAIAEKLEPQIQRMAAQGQQIPPAYIEQFKQQMRGQVLDSLIAEQLLNAKVAELGIVATDEDVEKQLTEMLEEQKLSRDDFNALIAAQGMTVDAVKANIKKALPYRKLFEAQFEGKVAVTDADANDFYTKNLAKFASPEQVRASHILITVSKDPNTDPNQAKAAAKAKAEELLKQIKAGADFAELAKANSACPSAAKGGDLNFFGRGQMVPEFENVAFALEPNQVSDVVETQFGFHIIKVTAKKPASTQSFADAKADIITMLEDQKKNQVAKAYLDSLKAAAKIDYPVGSAVPVTPAPAPAPVPTPEAAPVPADAK